MRKRSLWIILFILLLVVIGVLSIIFVPKMKESIHGEEKEISEESVETNLLSTEADFFRVIFLGELELFADKHGYELSEHEYSDEIHYIYNAECYELPVQYSFISSNDGTGSIQEMTCRYLPYSEGDIIQNPANTGTEIKKEIEKFIHMLEQVFEVEIEDKYSIVSLGGERLSTQNNSSYEQLLMGEASLYFTLRDKSGFYWCLTSEIDEENGLLSFIFTNYFYQYPNNITDITVE